MSYYGPIELSAAEQVFRGMDGVYAIFAYVGSVGIPLDVGESRDVGDRLRDHDRRPEWFGRISSLLRRGIPVTLKVYATPTPATTRHAQGHRLWVEFLWRTYYKGLGYALCGQRP